MFNTLSIGVHAIHVHLLKSLLVDEIWLPRNVNYSFNFTGLPQTEDGSFSSKTYEFSFICVSVNAKASWFLLQALQSWFGLGRCICKKHYIIRVVCIFQVFAGYPQGRIFFFFFVETIFFYLIYWRS